MAKKYWIKGTIRHKGALRKKAKEMGLIKGDEKLSQTDLDKLEALGGVWGLRAREARTLMGLHKNGGLTKEKARQILHDKQVKGHPLTEQQRKFFGAIASGYPLRKYEGGGFLRILTEKKTLKQMFE